MSKLKVFGPKWAGPCSFQKPQGEGPACLFQLLGAPGIPGLVAAPLQCLPPWSCNFFQCLCQISRHA